MLACFSSHFYSFLLNSVSPKPIFSFTCSSCDISLPQSGTSFFSNHLNTPVSFLLLKKKTNPSLSLSHSSQHPKPLNQGNKIRNFLGSGIGRLSIVINLVIQELDFEMGLNLILKGWWLTWMKQSIMLPGGVLKVTFAKGLVVTWECELASLLAKKLRSNWRGALPALEEWSQWVDNPEWAKPEHISWAGSSLTTSPFTLHCRASYFFTCHLGCSFTPVSLLRDPILIKCMETSFCPA